MREIIFVVLATLALGLLIYLSYKSRQKRFPIMFVLALPCFCALYLFQFGALSSLDLQPLPSEANVIREKKEEAIQDAKEIEEAKAEILAIKTRLKKMIAPASPPTLKLTDRDAQTLDSGYCVTVQFTPSKNQPLESIELTATVDDDSDARILNFWPSLKGGGFGSNKDSKRISRDGNGHVFHTHPFHLASPLLTLHSQKRHESESRGIA